MTKKLAFQRLGLHCKATFKAAICLAGFCLSCIMMISCKKNSASSADRAMKETQDTLVAKKERLLKGKLIDPVGCPAVVSFDFDSTWVHSMWQNELPDQVTKSTKNFERLDICDNQVEHDTIKGMPDYEENNQYVAYEIPIHHVLNPKIKKRATYRAVKSWERFPYQVVIYASTFILPEEEQHEYRYYYWRKDLVIFDSAGKQVDGMPLQFTSGTDLSNDDRFFYIDTAFNIYTADFTIDEINGFYIGRGQWRINSDGKIIPWYTNDSANIQNSTERGYIRNHTREGLWLERFPIPFSSYLPENLIAERHYIDGVKEGIWHYYKATNKTTDWEKGTLLFTETYENGLMKRREFYKNGKPQ
jgi:hypothetical protein